MKAVGYLALAVGIASVVLAFLADTTVGGAYGDRTHNLGLLERQMIMLHAGIGSAIVGSVLAALGTLLERLEEAGVIKAQPPTTRTFSNAPFDPKGHIAPGSIDDIHKAEGLEAAKARLSGNSPGDGARV